MSDAKALDILDALSSFFSLSEDALNDKESQSSACSESGDVVLPESGGEVPDDSCRRDESVAADSPLSYL